MQGLHSQILPWTDDTCFAYEQLGAHSHYGRLAGARRALRPSPRLGLARRRLRREARSSPRSLQGLGGAFLAEEREPRATGVGREHAAGAPLLAHLPGAAPRCSPSRGFDVSALRRRRAHDSADDVCWFPNIVGPIYPGSAIAVPRPAQRRRSQLGDQGHVGARVARPGSRAGACPSEVLREWHDRNWGEITEQDYRISRACSAACARAVSTDRGSRASRRATSCTCIKSWTDI